MLKLFAQTYTVSLAARVAAYLTLAGLLALGYFNGFGAYVIAWAPYATPELARILFWALAALIFILLVVVPIINFYSRRDLWAERDELELSAIACLSVGKPIDEPYEKEPQLSRHRFLKDAVRNGLLKITNMAGDKPNIHTTVSREDFRAFAARYEIKDFHYLLVRWDRVNPPKKVTAPSSVAPQVDPLRDIILNTRWKLNYNPSIPNKEKDVVFKLDGTFGEGGNPNEFRWAANDDCIEIWRESGLLQNKFTFDEKVGRLVWVKDDRAKGIPFQYFYRPDR
jgi:hypothetical protein